jgi:hypothetical protein
MIKGLCLFTSCLLLSATLSAQTLPSAEGHEPSLWVGAEVSSFNPDYGCNNNSPFTCWNHQLLGIAPYADANRLVLQRVGAEAEARFLHWRGPSSMTQATYMAGPRITLLHYRRAVFNGKILFGDARITIPAIGLTGNYFAYAPGLTMDYRVARRLSARVDYEYQLWPSFKGNFFGNGGLTPNGLSFGLSYALIR